MTSPWTSPLPKAPHHWSRRCWTVRREPQQGALKVGAVVGACAVCCPALLLVPLGLLGGLGASATTVLDAPAWLVACLLRLTSTVAAAAVRRRLGRRRAIAPVTAQGRLTLPLTETTGLLPDQPPPS